MSTTMWKGSINFGLVSMAVKISAAARDERISLNQIVMDGEQPHAVGNKNYDKVTGEEVARADIKKGYMVGEGQYIVFSDADFESIEPKSSKIINVEQFVADSDIDPVMFDKSYYITPEAVGVQPYRLLVLAMQKGNKKAGKNLIAIGKWTYSGREHVIALRLYGNTIMMHTLFFNDEVRDRPLVDEVPVDDTMLNLAGKLLEQMTGTFDPTAHQDTYRANLQAMIDRRIANKNYLGKAPAAALGNVPDIMETLKASIAAAKGPDAAPKKRGKAKTAAE